MSIARTHRIAVGELLERVRLPGVLRLVQLHLLDLDVDDLWVAHLRSLAAVAARLLPGPGLEGDRKISSDTFKCATLRLMMSQPRSSGAVFQDLFIETSSQVATGALVNHRLAYVSWVNSFLIRIPRSY